MKPLAIVACCIVGLFVATSAYSQSTDPQPGLVARAYLGGDHPPLAIPTPVVAVLSSGKDFYERVLPLAEAELRGKMNIGRIEYLAEGYLILKEDSKVKFQINNMICNLKEKDLGNGEYVLDLSKGKHKIALMRRGWNDGAPSFAIADATTGEPVLFYMDSDLKREASKSVKVDKKRMKSELVGATAEQTAAATR